MHVLGLGNLRRSIERLEGSTLWGRHRGIVERNARLVTQRYREVLVDDGSVPFPDLMVMMSVIFLSSDSSSTQTSPEATR